MYIEQIYTNCLAEASYYIESEGEAVVIDPIREPEPYLELAQKRNATIKYVFETHFHADFISGHIDLAEKAGATIVYGPNAKTSYQIHQAADNEVFRVGNISLTVLHTPGHTLESTCYLLKDQEGTDHAIFTGDTLFVGDVGRPDLLDGVATKEQLASLMYDSLNTKIKPLADEVIVYPAHGPGSACGKNIGQETFSTIGKQKMTNYALQDMSREAFIEKVTANLTAPPAYFFADARINREGYQKLDSLLEKSLNPLTLEQVKAAIAQDAILLDTRSPETFEKAFPKGAINLGLDGNFALWAGALLDMQKNIVLIADAGHEQEAVTRLARVGFDNVLGYLQGGFGTWQKAGEATDSIESISPQTFEKIHKSETPHILDVRKASEFDNSHLENAQHLTLSDLEKEYKRVPQDKKVYIHCLGGYRSMIASSILKKQGLTNVVNIKEGFRSLETLDLPLVVGESACSAS